MLESLINIVKKASELMATDAFDITQKGGYSNIVTSSDVAVQEYLCKELSALLPGSGFLCEEEDAHNIKPYTWIIDPIDGTANYARGIDQCCISVGLKHDEHMELGVVYLPRTKELFSAERGKGAFRNGRQIHVSDRPFQNAILCTALSVYHKEYTKICSDIITDAFVQCNDLRRFGAAAAELCYVAMGRCELYFEYLLSPWDFAAAHLILTEAGGCLSDLQGNTLTCLSPTGVFAANNKENLQTLQQIASRHLPHQ